MDPATKVRAEPVRLSVLVPAELYARLDDYRERIGVTASAFGRRAIERMLDEVEGGKPPKRPRRKPAKSA